MSGRQPLPVTAALGVAVVWAARRLAALRAAPSVPAEGQGPASAAPVWEPSALRRLAAWEPAPPPTAGLRLAAVLWAAPLSAAGLLAGLGSLRVPRLEGGIVLFARARGLTAAALRRRGFAAATLGHVVLALGEPSPELLAHELLHVRQAERLGVLMAPAYLGLMAPYGYARHPMERAARLAGQRSRQRNGSPQEMRDASAEVGTVGSKDDR